MGTLADSPNVASGAATPASAPRSPLFAASGVAALSSPAWIFPGDRSPGLNDSTVDERANFIAEALAREPTDEDVRGELRRALEAKRENEALRDHIEHLKTGELDQGLEASKRMAEMSSEFMARVEELTRERDASRARADAAEREAREFAAYMRERGFGAAPASATPAAPRDGDVSIGDDGIDAAPAATLFASPLDPGLDRDPSDYIATPVAPESVLDASFDFGGASNGVSHASSDASSLDPETLRADAARAARSLASSPSTTPSGAAAELSLIHI